MAVPVSYPGVYIREFSPGAPIQGVGTSTAAFIGPATKGISNEPIKITSWDDFLLQYGEEPQDGFYLWYAVRGFFENGGQVCYVTRTSSASFEERVLDDQSGQPTIRLRARQLGDLVPNIQVTVDDSIQAVKDVALFRQTATVSVASGTTVTVTDSDEAAEFRPGDIVTINGTDTRITRISGATINIDQPVTASNGDTVNTANLDKETTILRVENAAKLSAGSVIRISQDPGGGGSITEEDAVVKGVLIENLPSGTTTYRVELAQGLDKTYDLSPGASDVTVSSFEFSIKVVGQDPNTGAPFDKTYTELSMRPEHPKFFKAIINEDGDGIITADLEEPPNTTTPPNNRPVNLAAGTLTGGTNDNPSSLTATNYIDALRTLEAVDDINFIAIPDRTDQQVQQALISHCERMHDRFAILDTRRNADPFLGTDSADAHLNEVQSQRGFAALYYPWVQVPAAKGNVLALVPPSGHVAGIYARIDQTRGVHKAPAGTEAAMRGTLGVATLLSDIEQGELNRRGVNVIRVFATGGRPIVWGARTTAVELDTNWQYINVRRLFLFLEESIQEGIRWAVFEPNNLQLWQKLKRTITEFLTRVWRDGALFGETPEEAFYVRIDEVLNPFSEQALGRLNIEIGVRPSYPAEFIIVHIGIFQGGTDITEV